MAFRIVVVTVENFADDVHDQVASPSTVAVTKAHVLNLAYGRFGAGAAWGVAVALCGPFKMPLVGSQTQGMWEMLRASAS